MTQYFVQTFLVFNQDVAGLFHHVTSAVSLTSVDVRPWWMYLAASGPTYSPTAVTKEMISGLFPFRFHECAQRRLPFSRMVLAFL